MNANKLISGQSDGRSFNCCCCSVTTRTKTEVPLIEGNNQFDRHRGVGTGGDLKKSRMQSEDDQRGLTVTTALSPGRTFDVRLRLEFMIRKSPGSERLCQEGT